jgi:hypothetical protein
MGYINIRRNWPDLRRDYDASCASLAFLYEKRPVEGTDLIYEGITTRGALLIRTGNLWRNWPDLRRDYDFGLCTLLFVIDGVNWRNWPDLRRDYDLIVFLLLCPRLDPIEGTDLIYEGITTLPLTTKIRDFLPRWRNWPDLRRDYDICIHGVSLSFVRRNWPDLRRDYDLFACFIKLIISFKGRNWPDLRRDYDHSYLLFYLSLLSEGTDLIYEGITTPTSIRTSKWLVLPRWRNWPDLRRDYDDSAESSC